MKAWKFVFYPVLMLMGLSLALAESLPLRSDLTGDRPAVEIIRSDQNQVLIDVRLPVADLTQSVLDGRNWNRVEIPGGGFIHIPGAPAKDSPVFDDRVERIGIPEADRFRVDHIEMAIENNTSSPGAVRGAHGNDIIFILVSPRNPGKPGVVRQQGWIDRDQDR